MTLYSDLIDDLGKRSAPAEAETDWREVVVDKQTGLPRQAGADMPEGEFIKRFRQRAERDLFVFGKGVMNRTYFTKDLHLPVCRFLQKTPPFRKMLLMPRDHAKTSIVSHCLPGHILIQPAKSNIYFPGLEGSECRILLAGEAAGRAEKNLRVVQAAFESNPVLRALWPTRVWEDTKRQAKKWNSQEMIIPRENDYPDSSVYAVGVGGAITGSRPNVIIKDDLISVEAANSEVVMESAIEWHIVSRALMDEYEKDTGMESLEFIIGTRWAVHDLYSYIIDNDPSVEVLIRHIIEEGNSIWPERFDDKRIAQLKTEYGSMYFLLYMNEASDPSLVDFDMAQVRSFEYLGDKVQFAADIRDEALEEKYKGCTEILPSAPRGSVMNQEIKDRLFGKGRGEYLRFKYR